MVSQSQKRTQGTLVQSPVPLGVSEVQNVGRVPGCGGRSPLVPTLFPVSEVKGSSVRGVLQEAGWQEFTTTVVGKSFHGDSLQTLP